MSDRSSQILPLPTTEDAIQTWIDYKRDKEVGPMSLRPHPYEFFLYYDI